jgi:thymidylate synthase (FAD)
MKVEYVDKMGSDLTVVNAARVSYAKTKTDFSPSDEKLIKFLAEHEHWSPFGHASIQFRIKAPVFVARQLVKHQVGLIWNEVSRRYVDFPPEFFTPHAWRGKPKDSKQGSDGVIELSQDEEMMYASTMIACEELYQKLLDKGVAPEMARMVLPQNMYTEWYWSGSLYAFARVCNLRCAKDTQLETQNIANQIDEICKQKFPISWKYLRK